MFEDTPLENLVTGEDGLPTKVVEKNFWQKYVCFSLVDIKGLLQFLLFGYQTPANYLILLMERNNCILLVLGYTLNNYPRTSVFQSLGMQSMFDISLPT
jgi:hypothetical protein